MATFLDLGLFQYFNFIFPVLLIFAIVLAILQKFKILGTNTGINAIVAVAFALMSLLSQSVVDLINFIAPWFVVVFIFVILLLLIYQLLGATESDILGALKKDKTIQWAVFGVALVIILAGFGQIWGQDLLSQREAPDAPTIEGDTGSQDFEKNVLSIFFNTKVLGVIFIFLIAIFAVAFLAGG